MSEWKNGLADVTVVTCPVFAAQEVLLVPFCLLVRASGFVFTRLDGSMAQKKRVESIQCFQNTEAGSPTVMLLSLKAGGVGLNLSAASRVFLMDPVSAGVTLWCVTESLKQKEEPQLFGTSPHR